MRPVKTVKAAPLADPALKGKARVAKEGTTNRWIDEQTAVDVELSEYYARKLASGELVEVAAKAARRGGRDDD